MCRKPILIPQVMPMTRMSCKSFARLLAGRPLRLGVVMKQRQVEAKEHTILVSRRWYMLEASKTTWMTLTMGIHLKSLLPLTSFLKTDGRTTSVTNSATNGSSSIERSMNSKKEKLANPPTIWINKHSLRVNSHTRSKREWSLNSFAKLIAQCIALQWLRQIKIKHLGKLRREVQLESKHRGVPRVPVIVKLAPTKTSSKCSRESSLDFWKSGARRKKNTSTLRYLEHQQLWLSSCQRKNSS